MGHGADLYQRDGHGLTAEEAARKDDIKTFLRVRTVIIDLSFGRGDIWAQRERSLQIPYLPFKVAGCSCLLLKNLPGSDSRMNHVCIYSGSDSLLFLSPVCAALP